LRLLQQVGGAWRQNIYPAEEGRMAVGGAPRAVLRVLSAGALDGAAAAQRP